MFRDTRKRTFHVFLSAFLNIPAAQFKLVLDSVIWAFKHTMRNVADTGLNILYTMLQNVTQDDTAAQSFYSTYYTDILQHIFSVVTDSSHTAGARAFSWFMRAQAFLFVAFFTEMFLHVVWFTRELRGMCLRFFVCKAAISESRFDDARDHPGVHVQSVGDG